MPFTSVVWNQNKNFFVAPPKKWLTSLKHSKKKKNALWSADLPSPHSQRDLACFLRRQQCLLPPHHQSLLLGHTEMKNSAQQTRSSERRRACDISNIYHWQWEGPCHALQLPTQILWDFQTFWLILKCAQFVDKYLELGRIDSHLVGLAHFSQRFHAHLTHFQVEGPSGILFWNCDLYFGTL